MKKEDIIDCYDQTAVYYTQKYLHELDEKHFDQLLLKAFAAKNRNRGSMIDQGCGPGQTTNFLAKQGVHDLTGTDISEQMLAQATSHFPELNFEKADMLELPFKDAQFGSAIAFYSIVHFDEAQLQTCFRELHRILMQDGELLLAYHIGEGFLHLDEFLEKKVNIDFYFFHTATIRNLLTNAGFTVVDMIERDPYPAEYPSKRAYTWVKRSNV